MSKWYRIGLVGVIAVLAMALLPACQGLSSEPRIVATAAPSNAEDDLAATMTRGSQVWLDNCARCHGRTGEGTAEGAPLPDLTGHTDEQILASITNGVSNGMVDMPAFGTILGEEDLLAAMTYSKMISLAVSRGMLENPTVQPGATAEATAPAEIASAASAAIGAVNGTVINGTSGGTIPADMPLTLHVITSEISEQTFETTPNADGTYRIENVPMDAGFEYVLTAPYGDVRYVSEILTGDPLNPEMSLPITVYEGGATREDVVVTAMGAQVFVQNNQLQVIQIANFSNRSDRVYFSVVDGVGTSVELTAPAGATIQDNVSERYLVSADGTTVADTRPLLPGVTTLIHLAYALPYNGSITIAQPLAYPLEGHVDVVLASQGLSFSAENFAEQPPFTSGGVSLASFGADLTTTAGTPLTYTVSGTPVVTETQSTATVSSSSGVTPLAYILIGAGISALLIAGYTLLRERMNQNRVPVAATPAPSVNSADKAVISDLMEQIADLDAEHKAGKVNARDYQRRRTALKKQLSALMTTQQK